MIRIASAFVVLLLALCALPAQAQQRAPLPTANGVTPAREAIASPRPHEMRDRVERPVPELRVAATLVEEVSMSDQHSIADQARRAEDLDAMEQRLQRLTDVGAEAEREAAAARRRAAALVVPAWYRDGRTDGRTNGRSATITVNTLAGDNDGTCGTNGADPVQDCSLLEAVTLANADLAPDVIAFSVAGTIPIATQVQVVTPVEIDGTTAPGGAHQVRIDASAAVAAFFVIGDNASGTVIRGLVVGESTANGIVLLNGATGTRVLGNYIGTDPAGTDLANAGAGVSIQNASDNEIGGAGVGEGNVIGRNVSFGAYILGATSTGNRILGNHIGTDASGADLGNLGSGVAIVRAPGNDVGGAGAGEGNVIGFNGFALNGFAGVYIRFAEATGNRVLGNHIGTDAAGSDLGNGTHGVFVEDAPGNLIGGAGTGEGNLIGRNGTNGLLIQGADATGNVVLGNLIGTNAAGDNFSNNTHGVFIDGAPDNLIGGAGTGEGNAIRFHDTETPGTSGIRIDGVGATGNVARGNVITNNRNGVVLGSEASDNTIGGAGAGEGNTVGLNRLNGFFLYEGVTGTEVLGNYVGTDAAGNNLGNPQTGIVVSGAFDNTIGRAGAGNTVGFNGKGIQLQSGTTGNVVQGNYVGTDAAGSNLGNLGTGIVIGFEASDNTIGGAGAGEGNTIGFNQLSGIFLQNAGTTGNVVLGNYVGTDAAGTNLGNGGVGIFVGFEASGNTIGGASAGAGNTIGFNEDGVFLQNAGTTGNVVLGNTIGTDAAGSNLGNARMGIFVGFEASGNTIGGAGAGEGNTIGFNQLSGIQFQEAGTMGNVALGNYVGTDDAGRNLGNTNGIVVIVGASGNTIGGAGAGEGNVIGFNQQYGVWLSDAGTTGNVVLGNHVGTDAAGNNLGNVSSGIRVQNASGNTIGGSAAGAGNTVGFNGNEGVHLFGASATGNVVLGNFVGTNAAGDNLGHAVYGILVADASDNLIGGSAAGAGNTVGFNGFSGITVVSFSGLPTTGNVVAGNFAGTNAAGADLSNQFGIFLQDASGNLIGGAEAGAGNTVGFSSFIGIVIASFGLPTTGNVVQGNAVGTNAAGADLANATHGILVQDATGNTIGGTAPGAANTVRFNAGTGILVGAFSSGVPEANAILGNAVSDNGLLGIDLSIIDVDDNPDGVTPNDGCADADAGSNGLQNFPVIAAAALDGTTTTVDYDLDTAPGNYRVEFFSVTAPDTFAGYGEGRTFLGAVTIPVAAGCAGTFSAVLGTPAPGSHVTATATLVDGGQPSGFGGTSEFSAAVAVAGDPPPNYDLVVTGTAPSGSPIVVAQGGQVTFDYTITNNTATAVSGDLWFTARSPSGNVVAQARILSGTLPGSQTIAATYVQNVPGNAPTTTYDYALSIGAFPNVAVDMEVFEITVTNSVVGSVEQAATWTVTEATPWDESAEADGAESAEVDGAASSAALPEVFALAPAYPNPFAHRATLGFDVPEAVAVRLVVYDVVGRAVAVLVDGEVEAGRHTVVLDGSGLPSGVYVARMTTTTGFAATQRVTLLR